MPDQLWIALDRRSKSILRRAAAYRHQPVGDFVREAALAEAAKVIREHETLTLSAPDWKAFYDALVNPPEPNSALCNAFAEFRKTKG